MGGTSETFGRSIEHSRRTLALRQNVQVWIWHEGNVVSRAHNQCKRSIGWYGENPSYQGLAHAKNSHRIERLLRPLHILLEVCERVLVIRRTPHRSHKEGSLHLDRINTENFWGDESHHEFLPGFSITRLLTTICSRIWCLRGRARSSIEAGKWRTMCATTPYMTSRC